MGFLDRSLHMGLILESRTKEVDIGHAMVDGSEACDHYDDRDIPSGGGLTFYVDEGDR